MMTVLGYRGGRLGNSRLGDSFGDLFHGGLVVGCLCLWVRRMHSFLFGWWSFAVNLLDCLLFVQGMHSSLFGWSLAVNLLDNRHDDDCRAGAPVLVTCYPLRVLVI